MPSGTLTPLDLRKFSRGENCPSNSRAANRKQVQRLGEPIRQADVMVATRRLIDGRSGA